MICCTDVAYGQDNALASGVLFEDWTDSEVFKTVISVSHGVEEYVSGSFYERELPCLVDLLVLIKEPIDYVVVDGFVWLDLDRPGLGHYLYESLNREIPIIGVAKRTFKDNTLALPVLRGQSRRPLWVTSAGCETSQAARWIAQMHGEFRLPTLLKLADRIGRDELNREI